MDQPLPATSTVLPAPLTTCIVVSKPPSYSETFIRAVIERLPGTQIVLINTWPTTYQPMRLLPKPLWLLLRGVRLFVNQPPPIGSLSTTAVRLIETLAVKHFLRHHNVDVVLAEYGVNGVAVLDACIASQIPLVVHFHGYDAFQAQTLAEYARAYQRMFAYATGIIAVSRAMEQQLIQLGAPAEHITYTPCGVDVQMFSPADPANAPPHFVAVGRFVEKKAPYLTILAFQQVLHECPAARLTMIGDGPLWEACRQMVASLGMEHAVTLHGVRPHADIVTAMQQARAFVQHSLRPSSGDSEGTPVAVLEAGASSLPVVATRHAGIKDVVIDGETGLLVDEGDVAGMAAHMLTLANDPQYAGQLGRKARAHIVAHFSMEQYLACVQAALHRAGQEDPPQ
ncbi:MAG: glycosyltransferase [Chloroflexaceae bacterium]|nr:glycosyltransferase [Chloroflexaceae bacterium]